MFGLPPLPLPELVPASKKLTPLLLLALPAPPPAAPLAFPELAAPPVDALPLAFAAPEPKPDPPSLLAALHAAAATTVADTDARSNADQRMHTTIRPQGPRTQGASGPR